MNIEFTKELHTKLFFYKGSGKKNHYITIISVPKVL